MTKRTWHITLDDAPHLIEMEYHSFISNRRIWVDGKLVVDKKKGLYGSLDQFKVGNHNASLEIFNDVFNSRQLVYIGEEVYTAKEDNPELSIVKHVKTEHIFWFNLGKALGLQYVAVPNTWGFWTHRLIGMNHNRLVWVRHSAKAANGMAALVLLIRYNPLLDQEFSFQQLAARPTIGNLLDNKKRPTDQIDSFLLLFSVSYSEGKEKGEEVAERIQQLILTISQHTRPINSSECEGYKCTARHNQALKLVLVNEIPLLLCQSCIAGIPSWGEDYRREYHKAPGNLGRGVWVSLITAFIGGLIGAVATLLVNNVIASLLTSAIFLASLNLMGKAKTKLTPISMTIAAAISSLGIVVHVFLTFLGRILREAQWVVSSQSLILYAQIAWDAMWADTRFLKLLLIMYAIGAVPFLILMLYLGQQRLSSFIRPKVEVIEAFNLGGPDAYVR